MKSLILSGADGIAESVEEDGITLNRTRRRRRIHISGGHNENTERLIPAFNVIDD